MSRIKKFFKSIKNKVIKRRNETTEHKTSSEDLVFIESTDEQKTYPLPYETINTRNGFMSAQSFPPPIRHKRKHCLRRFSFARFLRNDCSVYRFGSINNLPFVCSQLTRILYSLLIRDLTNSYLRNTKNHRKKAIVIPQLIPIRAQPPPSPTLPDFPLIINSFDEKLLQICGENEIFHKKSIINSKNYPKRIEYLWGGSYSKVYSVIEDNCQIVSKIEVLGERFRTGSNLRISQTKFLISDLINTQSLNNLSFICSQSTPILDKPLIRDLMNVYLRNIENYRKKEINIPVLVPLRALPPPPPPPPPTLSDFPVIIDSFDEKLLQICGQKQIIEKKSIFNSKNYPKGIKYLSGGSYSKVYSAIEGNRRIVLKSQVLGNRFRNGSNQRISKTKYLISDLINTKRLSDLNTFPNGSNYCPNFSKLLSFHFVCFKERIQNKSRKEVLITKLKFGGNQLNSYKRLSPKTGLSIASQLIASIAIAEEELEFEHRDLHSSNILIKRTNEEFAKYCINGNPFCVKLNGYFVTIIDTTFSRSNFNNEIAFNDLTRNFSKFVSNEKRELDRIYFEEKVLTQNKWDSFCPKTNLLWVKRILTAIRVKVEKSEFDRNCESMADYELIKKWESNALNYSSVSQFGQNCCSLLSKQIQNY